MQEGNGTNRDASPFASGDFYSSAFSFYSHVSGDVDPRTGMYSAAIDLPTGKGNLLRGPHFEFRLHYDALGTNDDGFGVGWRLAITELDTDSGILTLGSGDSHRIEWYYPGHETTFPDRKLDSFRLTPAWDGSAVLEHATGVVEYLRPLDDRPSVLRPAHIVNPGGNAIHFVWLLGPNGTPVLSRVVDDDGVDLLRLIYPDPSRVQLVIATGPSAPLEMNFERTGSQLDRVRIPALMELNATPVREEEEPVWAFEYRNSLDPPYLPLLAAVTSPDGVRDQVAYTETALRLPTGAPMTYMPAVSERSRVLDADRSRVLQTSRYTYDVHGDKNFYGFGLVSVWENRNDQLLHHGAASSFFYGSKETQLDDHGVALCTIERTYNHFHLLVNEVTTRGHVVQDVATEYGEVPGEPFARQPKSFQLPHKVVTTLYDARHDDVRRTVAVESRYDTEGDVVYRHDDGTGVTERFEYYPLDGDGDRCPPDPLRLTRRIASEVAIPGPGAGPTLITRYRYTALPVRRRNAVPAYTPEVYVQACAEAVHIEGVAEPLWESEQAFIVDQGEQHGAILWETRVQDNLMARVDYSYELDTAMRTLTTQTKRTTHDGIVQIERETRMLLSGFVVSNMEGNGIYTNFRYDRLGRMTEALRYRDRSNEFSVTRWRFQLSTRERWVERIGTTDLPHRSWLDELGRVVREDEPLADDQLVTVRTLTYDPLGEVAGETRFDRLADDRTLKLTTCYAYDDWGQCARVTSPDGSHVRSETVLVRLDGEVFTRTTVWREANGERIGGWQSTDTDAAGRQRRSQVGEWDGLGNAVEGPFAQWQYDGLGRCVRTVDALGRITGQSWDAFDRQLDTTLPDGAVVRRTYAPGHEGELLATIGLVPAGGGDTIPLGSRYWDGWGRLTHETAGSLTRRYAYVPGQFNPEREYLPAGGEIQRTYEPWLNEALLTETLLTDPPVPLKKANYHPRVGVPVSLSSDIGVMDIRTDYLGRMTGQDIRMDDSTRFCNVEVSPGGLELARTGVDGVRRVSVYDDLGRVVRVDHLADDDLRIVGITFDYDALSRPSTCTIADARGSLTERVTYDGRGRVSGTTWLIDNEAGATRRALTLHWRDDDKLAGRRWYDAEDRLLREETMDYDLRGRLETHTIAMALAGEYPVDEAGNAYRTQRFTHDDIDNLLAVETTLVDGRVNRTGYAYDTIDRDRLVGVHSTLAGYPGYGTALRLGYDANGHLVDDGMGRSIDWDGAGRLIGVRQADGVRTDYGYGPDARIGRIRRAGQTTYRYFDDGLVYGEFNDTDQRRYLRAGGTVVAESVLAGALRTTWLVGSDPQGSAIVESGANATTMRTYGAFGYRDTTDDGARTGFAGEARDDDIDGYMLGDRPYSPRLQRFLCPDRASPFGAGGLNRYAYCAGDPVNRIDPGGNAWWDWLGAALGIIGAVVATVATGGALLGVVGAAAAGSLTAAVSTPTMVVMATATILEVTSAAVEIASLAAVAAGDEETASILGWVAFGTGVASGAMSVGPAAGRAATRFVGTKHAAGAPGARRLPLPTWRRSGAGHSTFQFDYGGRSVTLHHAKKGPRGQLPDGRVIRRGYKGRPEVVPRWSSRPNGNGGIVHFNDTPIDGDDLVDGVIRDIGKLNDSKKIIVLTGVHGDFAGFNWLAGWRLWREKKFFLHDRASIPRMSLYSRKNQSNISVVDISGMSKSEVEKYWNMKDAHIINAYCFSGADRHLMKRFNIFSITLYAV
ncbi:RHS repeat-associated core domain-containing protein [Luteibacter sp. 9133]|uniref:RHS repeat-associated core domain-containing protein n=1 Tax=Luteibacter sp. 9133 TaxID=1500891 RepID=UPI0005B7E980|nr:RHS repeat-associated core domain-containing protein [Luteibacter sp. 9133]